MVRWHLGAIARRPTSAGRECFQLCDGVDPPARVDIAADEHSRHGCDPEKCKRRGSNLHDDELILVDE